MFSAKGVGSRFPNQYSASHHAHELVSTIRATIVAFVLCLVAVSEAQAATIVVDSVRCTLAEAIEAANTNAPFGGCPAGDDRNGGGDTIRLAADVVLTFVDNVDDVGCENGLPVIRSKIKIDGNKHIIARADNAPAFRLIDSRPGTLTLEDVTVSNGLSRLGCSGTGINGSNVTLIGCTVSNNHGGGYGSVEKIEGAGIAATSLTLTRTIVSDNDGQGIGVIGSVVISRSTIARNTWRELTFTAGGGLTVLGAAVIEDSTISDNEALAEAGVGGGLYIDGSIILTNSTVARNSAAGVYGIGGGIYLRTGTATLVNSTVSGNRAQGCLPSPCAWNGGSGGGIFAGGPYAEQGGGTLALIHSTVVENIANGAYVPGLDEQAGTGGGIIGHTVKLANTIVANNFASNPAAKDCSATDVEFTGMNLISDGTCGAESSGQLTGDPLLGPLADYGGLTSIHPLQFGSPAIDTITFTLTTGCGGTNIDTDQRRIARPQPSGGNCDVGAVEYTGFPLNPVLDNFNRVDGTLGSNWSAENGKVSYRVLDNQIDVRNGGPLYWAPSTFGAAQETYVTLARIDRSGGDHKLLLKVQGSPAVYTLGAIEVVYDSRANVVRVETLLPGSRSSTIYPDVAAVFQDGDQFGSRVYPNGDVAIYRNNVLLSTVKLTGQDQQFFNERGGRIGLWFDDARNATFDSFGGGTVSGYQ